MEKKLILTSLLALLAGTFVTLQAKPRVNHVVLLGLDGWGAYSVEKAEMPFVKQLMKEGCYTLGERSVLPSESAANWASMVMGAGPELHGFSSWNTRIPEPPSRYIKEHGIFPTIFQLARDRYPQAELDVLYDWEGIKYVVDTLALSHFEQSPDYEKFPRGLCDLAVKTIKEKRPTLLMVAWDQPDHVGHAIGHDTPAYYEVLTRLDGYVAEVVRAMKEAGIWDESVLIITADHGGVGKSHGKRSLQEMEVPFIICGKGVKQGGRITESMMQFDCAATIARLLDLTPPQVWIGRPLKSCFVRP